jgi:uncharacterized protein (TIGR04141 family)
MAQTDQISINRLDPAKLGGQNTAQESFGVILGAFEEKERAKATRKRGYAPKEFLPMEGSSYHDVVTEQDIDLGVYFSRKSYPHKWASFLGDVAPSEQLGLLHVQSCDILVLLPLGGEIYAFTSGAAHHVISQFVDDSFPIEIAKRLLDPEKIKQTKERLLIGSLYARDRYFRNSYRIAASEAFGRVWKMVWGAVKKEAIQQYGLDQLFDGDRELTCEVKSAFKVNKRVSFDELVELVRKLDALRRTPLTDEQKQSFGFLNSVKQISASNHALIGRLHEKLLRQAYAAYGDPNAAFDFDFCHTEYDRYLSAVEIMVHLPKDAYVSVLPFDDGKKVMRKLAATFTWPTFADFAHDAENSLMVSSLNQENPASGTVDKFVDHFHGEIKLDGKSYFLIDGIWYEIEDTFLDRLEKDFLAVLNGPGNMISRAESPFLTWAPSLTEGKFNESHKDKDDYIVCDRILPFNIELCDVMIIRDGELILAHNKLGLGASTRDVCSQIFNAARLIQESIKSDQGLIKEYYRLIVGYHGSDPYRLTTKAKVATLGEDAFVRLFTDNDLVFVLGFADDASTERMLDGSSASSFDSNIARFEIVTLFENIKSVGPRLKICQIYRS